MLGRDSQVREDRRVLLRRIMPVRNRGLFVLLYVGLRVLLLVAEHALFGAQAPVALTIAVYVGVLGFVGLLAHLLGWYEVEALVNGPNAASTVHAWHALAPERPPVSAPAAAAPSRPTAQVAPVIHASVAAETPKTTEVTPTTPRRPTAPRAPMELPRWNAPSAPFTRPRE
jgi:hypothetical protein